MTAKSCWYCNRYKRNKDKCPERTSGTSPKPVQPSQLGMAWGAKVMTDTLCPKWEPSEDCND